MSLQFSPDGFYEKWGAIKDWRTITQIYWRVAYEWQMNLSELCQEFHKFYLHVNSSHTPFNVVLCRLMLMGKSKLAHLPTYLTPSDSTWFAF